MFKKIVILITNPQLRIVSGGYLREKVQFDSELLSKIINLSFHWLFLSFITFLLIRFNICLIVNNYSISVVKVFIWIELDFILMPWKMKTKFFFFF